MDAACDQDREYRKKRRCEDFRPLQEKTKEIPEAFGSHLKCGIGILEYVENAIKIAFIMVAYLL